LSFLLFLALSRDTSSAFQKLKIINNFPSNTWAECHRGEVLSFDLASRLEDSLATARRCTLNFTYGRPDGFLGSLPSRTRSDLGVLILLSAVGNANTYLRENYPGEVKVWFWNSLRFLRSALVLDTRNWGHVFRFCKLLSLFLYLEKTRAWSRAQYSYSMPT